MPKKHEQEDRKFIKDFARQLKAHYKKAKLSQVSDEAFAESLDVTRPALQGFLDGKAMPTIRALALAVDRYGLELGYEGTEFRASRRGELMPAANYRQLSLPLLFVSPDPRVALKVRAETGSTVTLGLSIRKAV